MRRPTQIRRFPGLLLPPVLLLSACSQQSANVKREEAHDLLTPPRISLEPDSNHAIRAKEYPHNIQNPQTVPQDYDSIWSRLFNLYKLPDIENERVAREMDWFLAHPDYIKRVQERAEPYLYTIVEEMETNGMPGELALLPVIESAFKPSAYSNAHAAGLWQFIPSTGRFYGLEQNWWYDGRRDVYASTKAAVRYLKKLSNDFDGDWFLALAAYNSGEGTVSRAIRANSAKARPTDYWALHLPRETETYVPRLIAVSKIFANAEEFGIDLKSIPNQSILEPVDVGSQIDLTVAADLADMTVEELFLFNPGFSRNVTAPNGPHRLLLPTGKIASFKEKLASLSLPDRVGGTTHRVRRGDTLSVLAERYNTSVTAILEANNLPNTVLYSGNELAIPRSGGAPVRRSRVGRKIKTILSREAITGIKRAPETKAIRKSYRVQKGDTFWNIAHKNAVSMKDLERWNNIRKGEALKIGQKLVIWQKPRTPNTVVAANRLRSIDYTVRKGDSLFLISRRFNVSVTDLQKWNSTSMGKVLQPGQVIKVKVNGRHPSTEEG